jgi:hypothetical protein
MSGEEQLDELEKLNSVDIVTKTDEGEEHVYCVNRISAGCNCWTFVLTWYCVRGRSVYPRSSSCEIPIA